MLIPICVIVRQELTITSDHLCVIPVILVADYRSIMISPTDLDLKPFNLNGVGACSSEAIHASDLIINYNFKKIEMELEFFPTL